MAEQMTVYTTSWCGYCVRLKRQLEQSGITYHEVDIATDPRAAELVEQLNGGFQTVPTVVLPDGTPLRNPSLADVRDGLGLN